jgi:uncharacterized membrane protein YphA (DoxX/SURF4 family)
LARGKRNRLRLVVTLKTRFSSFCISASLSIPFVYHGLWNLGPEGEIWWTRSAHFPSFLRVGVGVIELVAAAGIWFRRAQKTSAIIIVALMIGGVFEHFSAGYSFKNNGYETPLAYFLVAASLLGRKERQS